MKDEKLTTTVQSLVADYMALRGKKKALDTAYKTAAKGFDVKLKEIEDSISAIMREQGVESVKTDAGTAYTSTVTQYSVADWDAFSDLVMTQGRLDLVQRRVAKTAVAELEDELGAVPAGLNKVQIRKTNIRSN